jgi:O-acetyl-ADP-ribose deacetylase (regulator of RNase III)
LEFILHYQALTEFRFPLFCLPWLAMSKIHYLQGDATQPQASGPKIIVHVCNDRGGWGKGFVLALSRRWPEPEQRYRQWFREGDGFELGQVQFVEVEPDIQVANMIGQHGMSRGSKGPPVRYEAIEAGLRTLAKKAKELSVSVHMPRIGCGLAGGKWEHVEPIIDRTLIAAGIEVYVYDFAG